MGRRPKDLTTSATTTPATTATATAPTPEAASGAPAPPVGRRRHRTGLKRTRFQVPAKMPAPVRALWRSASPEEQQRAHLTGAMVLKAWLGRATREEAAAELGLTPLRFWQL